QRAQTLTFPGLRMAAFSSLLQSNAVAKSIYSEELKEVNKLSEGPAKLRALVQLAKAAYQNQDVANFHVLSSSVFDKGIKAFDEDYHQRQQPTDARPGYGELAEIITFTASQGESYLVDRIRQMPDGVLKAHLLIYAAKGTALRRTSHSGMPQLAATK